MPSKMFSFLLTWATSIKAKIFSIVILSALGVAALALQSSLSLKEDLMMEKEQELARLVDTVTSIANNYAALEQKGELSKEEAQKRAMETIAMMRYNGSDYFFILDTNGHMIMHPFNADLVGQDVSGVKDINGVYTTREFVKIAREKGAGALQYVWPKPGESKRNSKDVLRQDVLCLELGFCFRGLH